MITIYTDGSSRNNPGHSGIGFVLQYGVYEKSVSKYIGITTNNVAELTAVYEALKCLTMYDKTIHLYTDSQYAIGVLSLGWKTKKNVQLINKIKNYMMKFSDLKLIKCKGHDNISLNERVDKLAKQASAKGK